MAFLKHVGKHGDRKVAIVFREIPGDEHMCLVVYPEIMQTAWHDALMKAIESPEAQSSDHLGEALSRALFPDGRVMLQAMHTEGLLKKIQTENVIVTPTPTSSCKLAEINNILREMKLGEEAIKRMAEVDKNSGMTGKVRPRDDFGREVGAPPSAARGPLAGSNNPPQYNSNGALGDDAIANNLRQQAERMAAEARGLLAESERMMKEVAGMTGTTIPDASAPKKRGRPAKAKVGNAA